MARPPKEVDEKKGNIVKFRATDAEKQSIEQRAFDEGLTTTDLIKLKVLGKEPKRRKASPERAILIKGLGDLGRIGSNINQIARALNRDHNGQWDVPKDAIAAALYDLTRLSNHIINSLESGH